MLQDSELEVQAIQIHWSSNDSATTPDAIHGAAGFGAFCAGLRSYIGFIFLAIHSFFPFGM